MGGETRTRNASDICSERAHLVEYGFADQIGRRKHVYGESGAKRLGAIGGEPIGPANATGTCAYIAQYAPGSAHALA